MDFKYRQLTSLSNSTAPALQNFIEVKQKFQKSCKHSHWSAANVHILPKLAFHWVLINLMSVLWPVPPGTCERGMSKLTEIILQDLKKYLQDLKLASYRSCHHLSLYSDGVVSPEKTLQRHWSTKYPNGRNAILSRAMLIK